MRSEGSATADASIKSMILRDAYYRFADRGNEVKQAVKGGKYSWCLVPGRNKHFGRSFQLETNGNGKLAGVQDWQFTRQFCVELGKKCRESGISAQVMFDNYHKGGRDLLAARVNNMRSDLPKIALEVDVSHSENPGYYVMHNNKGEVVASMIYFEMLNNIGQSRRAPEKAKGNSVLRCNCPVVRLFLGSIYSDSEMLAYEAKSIINIIYDAIKKIERC